MTFGEKFKAEREKRKLTQQEVADALGINRRMITRYENGISFPRYQGRLQKNRGNTFKVDVNYLLTEGRRVCGSGIRAVRLPWHETGKGPD
mgnify:CR=1 FL=1